MYWNFLYFYVVLQKLFIENILYYNVNIIFIGYLSWILFNLSLFKTSFLLFVFVTHSILSMSICHFLYKCIQTRAYISFAPLYPIILKSYLFFFYFFKPRAFCAAICIRFILFVLHFILSSSFQFI